MRTQRPAEPVVGRGEEGFGDRGGRPVHFPFSVPHGERDDIARREDPGGNLVEAWDVLEDGGGADDGLAVLT